MEEIHLNSSKNEVSVIRKNKLGFILAGCTGTLAVGLSVVCAPFVLPAFRRVCIPFVPASQTQIRNIFCALKGRQGTLVDLGSGDGRIVIDAAKRGFHSSGIELNTWLVLYSRIASKLQGVSKLSHFRKADLWKTNLGNFDNIVIFGVSEMMDTLEGKLLQEVKAGGCVAACRFPLPNMSPDMVVGEGIDTVWRYVFPKDGDELIASQTPSGVK